MEALSIDLTERRVALNGEAYTVTEYAEFYGVERGLTFWETATVWLPNSAEQPVDTILGHPESRAEQHGDATSAAQQLAMQNAKASAQQPAGQWRISASHDQVEVPKHMQTHTRSLPLPFTIDAWILGEYYGRCQYLGHGLSKVCYCLTDTLVLKLREKEDQEPELFQELWASGVYPMVHASGRCEVVDPVGRGPKIWHAWIIEKAKPLDQILRENPAASNVCITGAVRAMLTAHSRRHILSDNGLFNLGMLHSNVVIIDAGDRPKQPLMSKGTFNKKVMNKFWSKAQTLVHPKELQEYREEWQKAGSDMVAALQTYETRWQELRNDGSLSVLNGLEGRSCTATACPHVASVIDSIDTDTLNWLTLTYLWGKVAEYGRSSDGYIRQQDRAYTAAEKLEQLIEATHAQRLIHCDGPAEDIVNEDKLKVILDAWKNDYEQWMRPETLSNMWHISNQQWHLVLRTAFRSHLFQLAGSYDLAVFFLVAPFNNDNLSIFRRFRKLERCKQHVRQRDSN
jgi:hypothetical protein